MTLCRIYVTLRDGAAYDWITPKLEAKKLLKLSKDLTAAQLQTGNSGGGARLQGPTIHVCLHCGTVLHGSNTCPWASNAAGKAKERGRLALRALGAGTRPIAEAAGNQEG
jgi:hypothetical protein